MLWGGPVVRAVVAWLLATVATTLAFSRDSYEDARLVGEFVVLLIFNLAFTALVAFAAYGASRWFVSWETSGDPEELLAERVTLIMLAMTMSSLAYYLFAFR